MSLALQLLSVPLLLAGCAFCVVAEFALVAVRSSQIEQLRDRRPGAAAALRALKGNMTSTIGTIQVCITVANLLLGWLGEPAMTGLVERMFGDIGDHPAMRGLIVAFSFVVVTFLTVVLSENVPKALALQYAVPLAIFTARPVLIIQRILSPLVWVMNVVANLVTRMMGLGALQIGEAAVTSDELKHITSEAAELGNLTQRERSLILNSLTLGRRTAAEVMVPRVRVNYLDLQRSMQQNLDAISSYLFSRMPLCDGGMDHVIGVVYTKEFLTAFQETDDSSVLNLIARPPVFAPVTLSLDRLLQRFHDDKAHLMFLVDEHGAVQGIVTLTDVVNELLGPMYEGQDARLISDGPGGLVVKGEMPITHLAAHLGKTGWASDADVRSVGGLVVARFGRVPRANESIVIEGLRLEVQKSSARAVEEVKVTPG